MQDTKRSRNLEGERKEGRKIVGRVGKMNLHTQRERGRESQLREVTGRGENY